MSLQRERKSRTQNIGFLIDVSHKIWNSLDESNRYNDSGRTKLGMVYLADEIIRCDSILVE